MTVGSAKKLIRRVYGSKNKVLEVSVDEYCVIAKCDSTGLIAKNIRRSVEEAINKKGPADYYIKVDAINELDRFRMCLVPKDVWLLTKL